MGTTNDAVNLILRGEPFRNFCHSFYDEFVEQNVEFRHRAGVKSLIIRRNLGGCCDWCQNLAGIYVYGEEPRDVYRRHDSCRCLVTSKFEGKGYQDVWSKKEFAKQRDARIEKIKTVDSEYIERRAGIISQIKTQEQRIQKGRKIRKEFRNFENGPSDRTQLYIEHSNIQPKLRELIEKQCGELQTNEVVLMKERIKHIIFRHPEDYELLKKYGVECIENPDIVLGEKDNKGTIFFIYKVSGEPNLNVVVRLALQTDEKGYKNSILTFHRMGKKGLRNKRARVKCLYEK